MLTSEIFISKSISLWGKDIWDYSKVIYIDYGTKVILICKKHSLECEQTPHQHLRNRASGLISPCIKCEIEFIKNLNAEKINRFVIEFNKLETLNGISKEFISLINTLLNDTLKRVPNGFWDEKDAVDCYIKWFKYTYNIIVDQDWYKIKAEDIVKNQGSGLISRYNYSLIEFLKDYYPEKEFLPWRFYRVGNNYWKDKSNRKYCLDWLTRKLNYTDFEDYYNLNLNIFCDNECARLIGCYQDSTYECLKDLCPEYKWKAYKFIQVPIKHWTIAANRKEWCEDYYNEHGFTSMEDWYKINQVLIKEWYGNGLLQRYKSSPYAMLKGIYPDYLWQKSKFKVCGYSKKSCEFTEKLSKAIGIPIQYALSDSGEYRIPKTNYRADAYIEKYNHTSNIIIEFHGCDVHGCIIQDCKFRKKNKDNNRFGVNFTEAFNRTTTKQKKIKELGYILIELWECEYKCIKDYKKWFEEKLNNYN
jgi:G:T-mismatch repair DNA endonuclease (very short patch repair protein)